MEPCDKKAPHLKIIFCNFLNLKAIKKLINKIRIKEGDLKVICNATYVVLLRYPDSANATPKHL